MSILRDLISEIKTNDLTQQMREICDRIKDEEARENPSEYLKFAPRGPNIFLCLQVPGSTMQQIGFLTLERENEDLYLAVFWESLKRDLDLQKNPDECPRPRKKKVHELNDHRPEKILTQYAQLYKFYKGE